MRISTIPAALAACLTLTACGEQEAGFSDRDRSEATKKLANSVVAQDGVPGIAIAIFRDGKPFQKLTLGSSDLAAREPVSSATPFQLASTTKIFSSAGVLLLVADGEVRLDDADRRTSRRASRGLARGDNSPAPFLYVRIAGHRARNR